uniref:Putative ovule protein n=1 Tax=Solanum chacoense TaxID=4108 RepID=A0A0V0GM77_SOLCH
MSFTQQVSEELGVPNVGFWTASGCSLWAFTQYPKLVEQGYTPIKGMKITCLIYYSLHSILNELLGYNIRIKKSI